MWGRAENIRNVSRSSSIFSPKVNTKFHAKYSIKLELLAMLEIFSVRKRRLTLDGNLFTFSSVPKYVPNNNCSEKLYCHDVVLLHSLLFLHYHPFFIFGSYIAYVDAFYGMFFIDKDTNGKGLLNLKFILFKLKM